MSMTKQEFIHYQKQEILKAQQIYRHALQFTPQLFSQENYPAFLRFIGKWQHYPIIDIILLYMQCPQAAFISGFKKWQELASEQGYDSYHLILKEGQKKRGISLLIPFSLNHMATGQFYPDPKTRYLTYKSILVFDVSQVNQIAAPPSFSPYAPIHQFGFSELLLFFRKYFSNDFVLYQGMPSDPYFKYSVAYSKNEQIFYLDSYPDDQKALGIFREIIFFYCRQYCKNNDQLNFVQFSVLYTLFDYFHFSTEQLIFPYLSQYQTLSSTELIHLLHFICFITQQITYKIRHAYTLFLTEYSDLESNHILKEYSSSLPRNIQ